MAGADDPLARPQAPPEVEPKASGGRGGKTALRIGGWILAVLGGVLVISGFALIIIHLTQRGKDGYYTSSTAHVTAPGYAVTAEGLHIGDLPSVATDVVGRVRVSARSSNGQALFVGIAPQDAVNAYLAGVARSEVTDITGNDTVKYKTHPGRTPAGPPTRQSFWQSASTGSGQVTATWKVKGGTWAIVLMNATGAAHVTAAVSVGAKTNLLLWLGLGSLLAGLIAGGAGTAMLLSSGPRPPTAT
ncbi:MAG: hypothetical protein ACXVH3_38350 [Solirubrobacteraceae bacterium]